MKFIFRLFVEAILIIFLLIFFDVPSKFGYVSKNTNLESIVDDCKESISNGVNHVTDFYNEYSDEIIDDCKEYISEGTNRVKKVCSKTTPKVVSTIKNKTVETISDVTEDVCELISDYKEEVFTPDGKWVLVANEVEATVYNAVPSQCDDDPTYTASMFRLDLNDVYSHKIIAMERTFMRRLGLKYGDVVKIEGTGRWDGVWQIQDTMNTRFIGKKKIDFLVPKHVQHGKWNDVKIYSLINKEDTDIYKYHMAPQVEEI